MEAYEHSIALAECYKSEVKAELRGLIPGKYVVEETGTGKIVVRLADDGIATYLRLKYA